MIATQATQLVVVVAANWTADHGRLMTFERDGGGWRRVAPAGMVTLGRTGLAWGKGIHPARPGLQKREGDDKAPAGIFRLGDAFGYLPSLTTGLDYQALHDGHYCIDDPHSRHYNQLVERAMVGDAVVARSTEPMRRDIHRNDDQRYKKGLWVHHNVANEANAGSCIFMHLWQAPGVATAGCTAMAEPLMDQLLAWLDRRRQPHYVVLPRHEYHLLQTAWGLPVLSGEFN